MNQQGIYAGLIAVTIIALAGIMISIQPTPSQESVQSAQSEQLQEVQHAWLTNAILLDKAF